MLVVVMMMMIMMTMMVVMMVIMMTMMMMVMMMMVVMMFIRSGEVRSGGRSRHEVCFSTVHVHLVSIFGIQIASEGIVLAQMED